MTSRIFVSSCILASLLCSMSTGVVAEGYVAFKTFPNVGRQCSCLDMVYKEDGNPKHTLTLAKCSNKDSQLIGQEVGKNYSTEFHPLQFNATGNVLDVSGGSVFFGGEVIQWPLKSDEEGRDNQLWKFKSVGGLFHIINKYSGLCLTANDNVNYQVALLQNTCCSDNSFQLWDLDSTQCSVSSPEL